MPNTSKYNALIGPNIHVLTNHKSRILLFRPKIQRIIQIWECSAGGRRWVAAQNVKKQFWNWMHMLVDINACMGGNGMMRVGRRGKLIWRTYAPTYMSLAETVQYSVNKCYGEWLSKTARAYLAILRIFNEASIWPEQHSAPRFPCNLAQANFIIISFSSCKLLEIHPS